MTYSTDPNMKLHTALTFGLLLATTIPALAQDEKQATLTKPVPRGYSSYGEVISTEGAVPLAKFIQPTSDETTFTGKVSCEVITSCTKKGCWMDVKMPDGGTMKVRFKDYGFFVPTQGLEGKEAIMQGTATKEVTDVAALRHYAHDAGKSKEEIEKITEPETSWNFEAVGVLIKQ